MKVRQLLSKLPRDLKRDGEILLAHLLKIRPAELGLHLDREIPPEVVDTFEGLLRKRLEGVPVAYLIGEWDFFGRTFKVREGVLIPRPETEILVERVLELIPEEKGVIGFEIGGGTGCVSITLLIERPKLKMVVDDINPTAVKLIRENAYIHGVENRIEILLGDMFEPVKGRRFDFIVSNPPYIPSKRWEELQPEVRREGKISLIGGERGYEFYERFSKEVRNYLKEGGFVALEIGHDQGKVVRSLLEGAGFKVMIYKDYAGQDRVVVGWN